MKRRSLQTKLQEIAKVGTLRTYSRDEAMAYFRNGFREDPEYLEKQLPYIRDAYDRGLILCSYEAYEKSDTPVEVNQITNSLAEFVLNIVYPFIFKS